ncbi:MAG: MBL fold metallo-hydrolase [Pseudomonadota bacterium]
MALTFNKEIHFEYEDLQEVAPNVRRLVARNPSPFTFKGTNTYVVGHGDVALIDPGPDLVSHRDALFAGLKGETITHIFLTHTHIDHSAGMSALQDLTGAITLGFHEKNIRQTSDLNDQSKQPNGKDFIDHAFVPSHVLEDGEHVQGTSWRLEALHTPGHAPDHLCYSLVDGNVLFSGDQVMAWNTSVVAPPEGRMSDYIQSLEKLLERKEETFFPGHGGRITTPRRIVKAYIMHRMMREASVLEAVKNGHTTITDITSVVYGNVEPHLHTACQLSAQAHLEYLMERNKVSRVKGEASQDFAGLFYPV